MNVHFVLPTDGTVPVGGYKVVYEYANGLVRRGHDVTVTHTFYLQPSQVRLLRQPRHWLTFIKRWALRRYAPEAWFKLDPAVKLRFVPWLHPWFMPKSDAIVATSWETAEWVAKYSDRYGRRFYLIQHFEDWSGDRDQVLRTWRLPLHKIVISRWLEALVAQHGESSSYITNGLDFNAFGVDVDPVGRDPHSVAMLYHQSAWKGSRYGLEALQQVHAQCPSMTATLFGVTPPPADLPRWVSYHQLPSQHLLREIYNRAAIFLAPSLTEGWGLPPAEAMICGAAVVLTDVDGHREFAQADVNALMCPPANADALAQGVLALMRDSTLRLRLVQAARISIQSFTWQRACEAMERTLATN
jgi:glycosyltransferase involved in cell wall biosynthesis